MKINEADVITYLANDQSYRLASSQVIQNSPLYLSKALITDNNMTVVIEDASWDVLPVEGSEIAAYDATGHLVGSSIYTSPATVLSLWGDDATTTEKDGLHPGEVFNLKLWNTKRASKLYRFQMDRRLIELRGRCSMYSFFDNSYHK